MYATIHTRRGDKQVSEIRAAKAAARSRAPREAIDAPRGRKGKVLDLAKQIRACRLSQRRDPLDEPLSLRVNRRLETIYSEVIASRGGETEIVGDGVSYSLTVIHRQGGLRLLAASGWRHYSRRFGARWATLAYLCGTDDNGRWAVRVPGTVTTIAGALDAITPAEVKKAQERGKTVLRQGDVYAIETTKAHDGKGELPDRHEWDPKTRILRHFDHTALHILFPVRFVTQSTLRMGRIAGRGRGD